MLAAPGLPAMAFQISPSRSRYLYNCGATLHLWAGQGVGLDRVHIHFFGNGLLWFRLTAAHFWTAQK